MTDRYNGWENRETWALILWLGNEETLHTEALEIVDRDFERDSIYAEDTLKNWVENDLFALDTLEQARAQRNMRDDVGSLWRVNWREVADAFREEVK